MSNSLIQITGLVNQIQKPIPNLSNGNAVISGAGGAAGSFLFDMNIPAPPPPFPNKVGDAGSQLNYLC